jgi:FkbM family methyltransferase
MTKTRLKVLLHYLRNKNNVSLGELFNYFTAPSYKKIAYSHIQKVEQENEYNKIYFKEISDPLYYPKDFNEHSLRLVTVESFNPKNWHYYQTPETLVTPEDIVVDCGAAEGLFALIIQKKCKKIYLIEPLPKFVECLNKTFDKATNVEILPVAISDTEFFTKMITDDISSALSDEGEGEQVHVTTLDKIFLDKEVAVSYLKMDLEGYDYKALLGAESLIKKYKPKIAVTTYHSKEHATQIEQFLKSIVPEYKILCKGIFQNTGSPVMLHAWI